MSDLSLSAPVVGVGMQAQGATVPVPPPVPVTDVMVLLTRKASVSRPDLMKVMPEEARETMLLYLNGKIDRWYSRADGKGAIFFLRCSTVEEAKAILGSLPLVQEELVDLEFIPLGPLAPMRLLTNSQAGEAGAKQG